MVPDPSDENAGVHVVMLAPDLLAARSGRDGDLRDDEFWRQSLCPVEILDVEFPKRGNYVSRVSQIFQVRHGGAKGCVFGDEEAEIS